MFFSFMSTSSGKDRALRQGFSLKSKQTKQRTVPRQRCYLRRQRSNPTLPPRKSLSRKMYVVANTSAECEGNRREVSLKPEL